MTVQTPHVVHLGGYITRDTQEPDTLYVDPDGACWYTPDGVGRIWLFEDPDEQTTLMDEDAAIAEMGYDRVVYLDASPTD